MIDERCDFVDPVKLYLDHLAALEKSPHTLKNYCRHMARFFVFLEREQVDWFGITPDDLVHFIQWLRDRTRRNESYLSELTVNTIVAAVSSFYRYHIQRGTQLENPVLVTLLTQFTCVNLTSYSVGTNTDLSSALTQVVYFKVKPGQEQTFEEFLAIFRSDYPKVAPDQNFSWYRIEDGGKIPQYLLFVPYKNQAERQQSNNFLARLWKRNAEARTRFQNSVAEVTSETMRYRVDLTFIPSKSATK